MLASVFPGGESSSVLSNDVLNLESPLDNSGYVPDYACCKTES